MIALHEGALDRGITNLGRQDVFTSHTIREDETTPVIVNGAMMDTKVPLLDVKKGKTVQARGVMPQPKDTGMTVPGKEDGDLLRKDKGTRRGMSKGGRMNSMIVTRVVMTGVYSIRAWMTSEARSS